MQPQAVLAGIHLLSSVLLLILAGYMSYLKSPLHSEVYILLGTYISSNNHILEYYFGMKKETGK